MIAGSVAALRRRIKQIYWSIFLQERKGGGGASYTCASLTSDKRIFQPTRVYRVTFTKAQGCGSMVVVVAGLEDGMGGRMNRWEERQKAREGVDMGKVFVSQRGSPDRFPSIHNALTAKNASCFPVFPPLFVRREV